MNREKCTTGRRGRGEEVIREEVRREEVRREEVRREEKRLEEVRRDEKRREEIKIKKKEMSHRTLIFSPTCGEITEEISYQKTSLPMLWCVCEERKFTF